MTSVFNLFGKKELKEIYQIDNFLNESVCNDILQTLTQTKFDRARQYEQGRHNKELFTEDEVITNMIKSHVEKLRIDKRKVKAFSFPFEFYRYDVGDYIQPHTDSPIILSNSLTSNFTALIYLNDNYFGGETFFLEKQFNIKPKKGSLILFQHHLVHEAQKIVVGTKFIYRSNWNIS